MGGGGCGQKEVDPWVGKIPRRRAWQPTPVSLPGDSYGQRSLAGYNPKGCKESDMTERPSTASRLERRAESLASPRDEA